MVKSLFDRNKELRPKPQGQLGWPRREHRFLEYSHEYHTSSNSSFWSRFFGAFTIYQESTPEVCETVIPSDWKIDRGSEKEISNLTTNDYKELTWSATSLICDKAFAIANAKTYVFADSVLCLGSMRDEPIEPWKNKIKWYSENNHLKAQNRIHGMQTLFEWKIFPGFTTLGFLEEIQNLVKDPHCEPEQFNDKIIFMSMHNDIVWEEQGNTEKCENNSVTVANYASRFPRGLWSFLGHGSERNGTEVTLINQT